MSLGHLGDRVSSWKHGNHPLSKWTYESRIAPWLRESTLMCTLKLYIWKISSNHSELNPQRMHGLQKYQSNDQTIMFAYISIGIFLCEHHFQIRPRSLWPTNNLRRAVPEANDTETTETSSNIAVGCWRFHKQVMVQGIISQRPSCKKQRSADRWRCFDVSMFLDFFFHRRWSGWSYSDNRMQWHWRNQWARSSSNQWKKL